MSIKFAGAVSAGLDSPNYFRPEIQGLRAIAVLVVLLFHLWPGVLSGGYVGVDVFFVISGFLITGLLLRQAEIHGRIPIADFYVKRIKRLLPAATVVLVAVGTCVSLLPIVRWTDTANEIAASALYFQNWWLAAQAVDYLAADNPPSPLQHFWSLSVEEQYYIAWPMLFAISGWCLRRRLSARQIFAGIILVVGASSLLYSIYLTPRDPGLAYFATTTRAWELALGGALAVFAGWERWPAWIRGSLGVVGLVMVLATAVLYDTGVAFPGYSALLPTLGAAALIVSGSSDRRWSVYTLLRSGPMQYVGDLSYSLYLWHWPAVIFYREIAGRELGLVDGLVVAVVSLALAHQSKVLIEDRFRAPGNLRGAAWKPFGFALVCISLPVLCWFSISTQVERHARTTETISMSAESYPGALALSDGLKVPDVDTFLPAVLNAKEDKGDPYRDRCIGNLLTTSLKECIYGSKNSEKQIVIVGDSHAVHWVPAFQFIAQQSNAKLTVITKSACAVVDIEGEKPELEQYRSCLEWSRKVIARLLSTKPDVVVFAHSKDSLSKIRSTEKESAELLANSFVKSWGELRRNGSAIVVVRDTPSFASAVPDCLAAHEGNALECSRSREDALSKIDPLMMGAALDKSVKVVDMTDAICRAEACDAVVGNVVAWRDSHHMTASFALTLAPALSRALAPLVPVVSPKAVMDAQAPEEKMGAAACDGGTCLERLRPSLATARKDVPKVYATKCHLGLVEHDPRACEVGGRMGGAKAFVIGDSHAAQWLPAFDSLERKLGWEINSYTKSACLFADVEVKGGRSGDAYSSCTEWNRALLGIIESERPQFLLVSQSNAYRVAGMEREEENFARLVKGLVSRWQVLRARGIKIVVLADTPHLGIDVPECLSKPAATLDGCTRTFKQASSRPDPLIAAAKQAGVPVVNMSDLICPGKVCPPAIDNVLVWRDSHHLTATFAEEHGAELAVRVAVAVKDH